MSDRKIYTDQPIPPRPSSSESGRRQPAGEGSGQFPERERSGWQPAKKRSGQLPAAESFGQQRGEYWKQKESRRRQDSDRNVSPAGQQGRSPWNYITEEELFSTFRPSAAGMRYGSGRGGSSASGAGRRPVPEKIRQLDSMLFPYQYNFEKKSRAFLEQARFMADYEEDLSEEDDPDDAMPVQRHNLPAYQELNIFELSSYFRWRTQIRILLGNGAEEKKEWPPVCYDFACILLFELINGIGPGSPEERLKQIIALNGIYSGSVSWPSSHVRSWIQDYILCYEMNTDYAAVYFRDLFYSFRTVNALADPYAAPDREILAAVDMYSAYHLNRSGLREQFPAETEEVTAAVVRALADYYSEELNRETAEGMQARKAAEGMRDRKAAEGMRDRKAAEGVRDRGIAESLSGGEGTEADLPERHDGLAVKIFGPRSEWLRQIFHGALFDPSQIADHRYVLFPARQFRFLKGKCYYDSFPEKAPSEGKRFLGSLIRETDRRLRIALAYGHPLREAQPDPGAARVIQYQIDLFLERKKEREKPVLKLDFSRLSGIRADSDYTAEQLLRGIGNTGEEYAQQAPGIPDKAVEEPVPTGAGFVEAALEEPAPAAEAPSQSAPLGLTEEEYRVLLMILSGENPAEYLRSRRMMQSVLVDSINEKFYDEIGDSVLEEADGVFEIVPDYREELEEMLTQS